MMELIKESQDAQLESLKATQAEQISELKAAQKRELGALLSDRQAALARAVAGALEGVRVEVEGRKLGSAVLR